MTSVGQIETLLTPVAKEPIDWEEKCHQQEQVISELSEQLLKLSQQIAWFKRQFFGRKSEHLEHIDPNQYRIPFEESVSESAEQIAAAKEQAENEINKTVTVSKKAKRHNRKLLEDLPVVAEEIFPENIDLSKYVRIGEEHTRTIEFTPGKLWVKDLIRPKYALKESEFSMDELPRIAIAPMPLLPIYKGLPGASLLAEILLQKYEYHIPFHRQVKQFAHLGIKIPEATLSGWFKPACELLYPLYEKLKEKVLASDYIQVDETTAPVISNGKGRVEKEYLWEVRAVMEKMLFFHYNDGSRSGKTAAELLKPFSGYLQSDGYQGYNIFESKANVRLVGCWAHVRRHFEAAMSENEALAKYALSQIQLLYHVERQADEDKLSFKKRARKRKQLSMPIIKGLEKWCEQNASVLPENGLMAKAIVYLYTRIPKLKVYINDGRLKIDNNLAENGIRPIALGRKNYLFCCNHEAAKNMAVICSLIGSCKAAKVNPREWLNDVIAKLPYYNQPKSGKDIVELLPINRTK